jgi:hypothetical protein
MTTAKTKLIGHTQTGKPIYNIPMTDWIYINYTKQDFSDIQKAFAKQFHQEELTKKIANKNKSNNN